MKRELNGSVGRLNGSPCHRVRWRPHPRPSGYEPDDPEHLPDAFDTAVLFRLTNPSVNVARSKNSRRLDWNFQPASDGPYWAATPAAQVDLPPGKSFDITVSGLNAVANAVQAEVSTAYYNVHGVSDGVFVDLVIIQQPSASPVG